jgi:chemotaxis protein methyltransferase CheR
MEPEIVKISEQIERNLGLHFPENRLADLKQLIMTSLSDLGFGNSFDEFYNAISSNSFTSLQYDILAMHLTVGETYFFREGISLQALKNDILPPLILERSKEKRSLRIWSAGCCSGEEAYTIAIMLFELLPDIASWNITIIGTDINRNFIQKAVMGRYTPWSFRTTPIDMLDRYFKKVGKEFEVIPEIKKMVSFSCLNLIDDKYPSQSTNTDTMDIILCRNVLMYFSDDQRAKVIHRFTKSLIHTGWLITSPVEVSLEDIPHLTRVIVGEAILYCKDYLPDKKKAKDLLHIKSEKHFQHISKQTDSLTIHHFNSVDQRPVQKDVLKDNNVSSGIKTHQSLETDHLKNGKTDFQKAEAYYNQGMYEDALALFKKVQKHNIADNNTLYYLAKTNANLGYKGEALSWCELLIQKETMNANYYYLLATILLELNKNDEAENTLKKVLYLDSQHILAHFVMGNYNRILGKVSIAEKHYQNIAKLLNVLNDDWVIPESDGITVARMKEMVALFR